MSDLFDYRQHRNLLSRVAKRSKYFTVAPGKVNIGEETRGQEEIGRRYYEGAAAGTVMIGQVPNSDSFCKMFPWPDAVIRIQPDGSDVLEILQRLSASPERVLAISQRNAAESLLRHDWVYRWKKLLEFVGLAPLPAVGVREQRLKEGAEFVLNVACSSQWSSIS